MSAEINPRVSPDARRHPARRLKARAGRIAPRVGLIFATLAGLLAVVAILASLGRGVSELPGGTAFSSSLPGDLASSGQAVLAQDDQLWLSGSDGRLHRLIRAPAGGHFENPAWRLDGQTIAYTLVVPAPPSDQSAPGAMVASSIWQVDRSGTARALVQSTSAGAWLSQPAWSPDGRAIYYVRSAFLLQGGIESAERSIEREDLTTSRRQVLVDDGIWPAIAPDGNALAWVRLGANGRADLWVSRPPTGTPRRLTDDRFADISSPRFSPDGRTIAFSAALFRPKYQSRQSEPSRPVDRVLGWLAEPADAHMLPGGLWLVDADGSHLRRIGTFALDGPDVRWTTNPDEILLHDEQGLYLTDVRQGQLETILKPGSYRGFDWLPKDWERRYSDNRSSGTLLDALCHRCVGVVYEGSSVWISPGSIARNWAAETMASSRKRPRRNSP